MRARSTGGEVPCSPGEGCNVGSTKSQGGRTIPNGAAGGSDADRLRRSEDIGDVETTEGGYGYAAGCFPAGPARALISANA